MNCGAKYAYQTQQGVIQFIYLEWFHIDRSIHLDPQYQMALRKWTEHCGYSHVTRAVGTRCLRSEAPSGCPQAPFLNSGQCCKHAITQHTSHLQTVKNYETRVLQRSRVCPNNPLFVEARSARDIIIRVFKHYWSGILWRHGNMGFFVHLSLSLHKLRSIADSHILFLEAMYCHKWSQLREPTHKQISWTSLEYQYIMNEWHA